ncbi:MAG: hypothetical protein KJZ68_05660 [Phycisphaerales bacterium]|nr:hypothetical protein [Phycisphaerales bacterium]
MSGYIFSAELVEQFRRNPLHETLRDLGKAARDANVLASADFRKLLGYLTELADGRDRREPMTPVAGTHRPQPRLRVLIDAAFTNLGDLTWFRLNKIVNQSKQPLKGMFQRMAASVGRLSDEDLESVVTALVSDSPDRKLLKLLNEKGGRVPNCGLELFARLAYLFRPDLYFVLPRRWGEESGVYKFIDNDLRKYCAVCRTLRSICDEVGFPADIRATLFDRAVEMDPVHPTLEAAINHSIGSALAWANVLEAGDGYVPGKRPNDEISMPLEVAPAAIRVRRGEARLRNQLIRAYRGCCAISGKCPKDVLEVAYVAPYPAGDIHSPRNAIPLRSDLHTLRDCNLIAFDPETLELHLSESLRGTCYEPFAGVKLSEPDEGLRLDGVALRDRWAHFQSMRKAGASASPPAAAPAQVAPPPALIGAPGTTGEPRYEKADVEIETFEAFEPRKSASSGIWRVRPAASGPTIPLAPIDAEEPVEG